MANLVSDILLEVLLGRHVYTDASVLEPISFHFVRSTGDGSYDDIGDCKAFLQSLRARVHDVVRMIFPRLGRFGLRTLGVFLYGVNVN